MPSSDDTVKLLRPGRRTMNWHDVALIAAGWIALCMGIGWTITKAAARLV
ncbi:hypothetical protein KZ686_12765 [Cupriavidus cauae]|jgi:hypothetical protein|nr:hypothetical protein [Cupriavidus cauae]UZN48626.1 hypothetical protein KZ686_12765 [Cupriavidus cauae]